MMTSLIDQSVSREPVAAPAPSRPATSFVKPHVPWSRRINWRMALLGALALLLVGAPVYVWLQDALSGGIINEGDYFRVNLKSMSSFDLDQFNGQPTDIPQRFRDLEGKHVALDGEMWAPNYAGDAPLSYFQLVYSKTKCCFSGPPLAQHFVDSNVKPGAAAEYNGWGMVRVWGTLHIKFSRDPKSNKLLSVYEVDVDKVDNL